MFKSIAKRNGRYYVRRWTIFGFEYWNASWGRRWWSRAYISEATSFDTAEDAEKAFKEYSELRIRQREEYKIKFVRYIS